MILSNFLSNPILMIVWLIAILIVLTVHEFSHAFAALLMGDDTAKREGRLTLNPLAHISWLGFFMLLLVGFGWGKPVPFNPYNLKYPRFGPALVAVAGPFSNLLMAALSTVVLKLIIIHSLVGPTNLLVHFLNLMIVLNLVLMLFNLLPFAPLDGSKIVFAFLSDIKYERIRNFLENQGPFILMMLIIFDNFLGVNLLSGFFSWVVNLVYKVIM